MPRVKFSVEPIIHKLREAEVLLGQGQTVKEICRKWNITDPTYYRWRQEYNHIRPHSSLGYKLPTPETTLPVASFDQCA